MKNSDQFFRIARISGAHGLVGRLKIHIITDILERFTIGNTLYLKIEDEYKPFLCTEFIKQSGKDSLLKLENIEDIDSARSLKGTEIFISKDEAERTRQFLEKDTFYHSDLIGCKVFWKDNYFGIVTDIIDTGSSSVLVFRDEADKEYMLPFVASMIDTEKVFQGRIDINPISGLIDE